MATDAQRAKSNRTIFVVASIYLIVRFIWRIFVEGGSWPLPPWHYISMGIDIVLVVALVALRPKGDLSDSERRNAELLFWFGLVAGAGTLLIRFTSKAAWWTGHLYN